MPTTLVDQRIQRCEIVVSRFFSIVYVSAIVQFDSVCANKLMHVDEGFYNLSLRFKPFTFSEDYYVVALALQQLLFFHGTLVDLLLAVF